MGTPLDIQARRYYRVAFQRFEDGRLMLDRLNRPKGAVYLAGYAVECILKALLLEVTPPGDRAGVLQSFCGAAGHDLIGLRARLARSRVGMPSNVAKEMAYLASWSVDLRYEPGAGDPDDAQRFMNSTRSVLEWANRRM